MRLVAALLLSALLPVAAADEGAPDEQQPCQHRSGNVRPGETFALECRDGNGNVLLIYRNGTCALGQYWYVQVFSAYAYVPCDFP